MTPITNFNQINSFLVSAHQEIQGSELKAEPDPESIENSPKSIHVRDSNAFVPFQLLNDQETIKKKSLSTARKMPSLVSALKSPTSFNQNDHSKFELRLTSSNVDSE